jgi:uncharacterized protein
MPRTRDEHLFSSGPKRILSLDGGGVRGMMTAVMLKRVEDVLKARSPDPDAFRLAHYFDLIGGTSTGAIIACWLALGNTCDSLIDLYRDLCPKIFKAYGPRVPAVQSKFSPARFQKALLDRLGEERLDSERLITGFALMAKRIDTGSPWFLYNNPQSTYWEHNRSLKLRHIVQASASAPYYLDAVEIDVMGDSNPGIFFDGAISPHNNPSLQLFLAATVPQYGFNWPASRDELLLFSMGTGAARPRISPKKFRGKALAVDKALHAISTVIYDTSQLAITTLQAFSEPRRPWEVNSEIKGLQGGVIGGRELLTFRRVDVNMDRDDDRGIDALKKDLDIALSIGEWRNTLRLDNGAPRNLDRLCTIGERAGAALIDESDFPGWFDPPAGAW